MGTFVSGIVATIVGVVLAGATVYTAVNVAAPDLANPQQVYSDDTVVPYGTD